MADRAGTFTTASADETEAVGQRIAAELGPGDVVLLAGALGAGKTCLVRGIAGALGVPSDAVHSPSYTLVNEYPARGGRRVVHADGYRLRDDATLDDLGLEESQEDGAIVLLEWPRGFVATDEATTWSVEMTIDDAERRTIRVTPPPGRPLM
ncbi:MAG: tRNA (adenosine(37)-N6)-threonylcarbamoyltransferase complex ATPase subunit type 1 TsaE [Nitrospirota bacterium]|jgi:tRNA threonylcarbamoyladenosine biosynthesis protein TsaE